MRQSGGLAFAFVLLGTAVIACGGGGMGDDDDTCDGVSNCSVQGSSCDGDTVVDCQPDSDGCLVESTVDCAASGQVCDGSGGSAMCVDPGCDDVECMGAADGDVFCDGDTLVSCGADMEGCLIATTEDCTAAGGTCDDSEAPAMCVSNCTDDAACAGMSDGDASCDGSFLNTCTAGADGCLDLDQVNCSPALCDDASQPAMCGTVTETGDSCADALVVNSSTFVLSGADFTADFTDSETFADASCDDGDGAAHQDAFFQVDLLDGQTVVVDQLGGLDTVRNVQATCGGGNACLASQDEPEDDFRYTATGDETVFVAVEPFSDTPGTTDYEIHISVDPVCGNGLVEAGEICDDANTDTDDGCDDTCTPEFSYECDGLSPSTCQKLPSLGTYAAGDTFSDFVVNGTVSETELYMITFTTDVDLSGTLNANNMGDPDFFLVDEVDGPILTSAADGDETFAGVVPAGTYLVAVDPFVELDMGYTLALSLGAVSTVGDGDTVTETGGALMADESDFLSYVVTEDVEITGTLTSTDGDVDLIIRTPGDDLVTFSAVGGDETFNIALPAGSYTFEVNAFDAPASDYTLDFTAATLAVPDIGTFAAGGAISDTTGGPVTPPAYAHHTITFSEDVLLSGSLDGFTTGDPDLVIYSADGAVVFENSVGGEAFTDVELAAGSYIVQIIPFLPSGDVDTYTVSLSTTAVP